MEGGINKVLQNHFVKVPKYGPEKTLYLDTFHTVNTSKKAYILNKCFTRTITRLPYFFSFLKPEREPFSLMSEGIRIPKMFGPKKMQILYYVH